MNAIECVNISKSFKGKQIIKDLSFSVPQGQVLAFLGPNGAGKTTTIDMILGLSKPDQGTVSISGKKPRQAIEDGSIAALMQQTGTVPDLTVEEHLHYIGSAQKQEPDYDEIITRCGLQEILKTKANKASGGEKQRLAFAISLLSRPEILILDEPTTGLDVNARRTFWEGVKNDTSHGQTVMFATHYLEEADEFADRIIFLKKGKIVEDGSVPELRARNGQAIIRANVPQQEIVSLLQEYPESSYVNNTLTVRTHESDAVGRYLFGQTSARNIEIVSGSLNDLFVELSKEDEAE